MIILDEFVDFIEVIRIKMIAFYAEMSLDRFGKELRFISISLSDFIRLVESMISYFAGLRVRVARCGLRVTRCGLQVVRCRLQVANCVLRVVDAGCEMRDASCELRLPNVEGLGNSLPYAYGISMAYLCNSFVLSGIDFIFGMILV